MMPIIWPICFEDKDSEPTWAVIRAKAAMRITTLVMVVLPLIMGCGQQPTATSASAPKQAAIRTDAAPITRRLPKLGSLQSVWWQSAEITTNSFPSPPPHPAYRVRGLAQLAKTKAEEFSRSYEWQKMPASWRPALRITNISLSLSGWNRSAAFTKDCKPQQLPGELFFERSSGFVYFDIEVE